MVIDFHVHSTASDGTLSPRELVTAAVRGGFAALALTDHDNLDGIPEFLAAARESPLKAVPGVELSIEPGEGFDKFHLLGLGVDPEDAGLKRFLRRILSERDRRNARMVERFRRLGIEMESPGDEVRAYAHGEVLARPHFAKWLVDHGYAKDKDEAFARYLLPDSPAESSCYEERYHPAAAETFAVIHAAGGVCAMAHPKYWRRDWRGRGCDYAAAATELRRLKALGLDALETRYQANTPEEDVEFGRIARDLGLVETAGSDFHGAHKPTIPLGMTVSDDFATRLILRLQRKDRA